MSDTCNTSKDELDLLGDDDVETFSGSKVGLDPNFLCHQHLCCVALSLSHFVALSSVSGRRRHTLYCGQYLKNGLSDLIQIWHVDVTGPGYSKFLIFHKLMSLRLHYFCVTSTYVGGQIWSVSLAHLLSREYLKNGMKDLIQTWHVTGPQGVPYFKVTLNSQ